MADTGRILRAATDLAHGSLLDWQASGGEPLVAYCGWGAPTMRQSTAAVALIRRQQRGQTVWLAQWNPGWQRYHFVAGHKRPNETFRECAEREIGEELDLQKGS